jgi:predicted membrane metal-binding protein
MLERTDFTTFLHYRNVNLLKCHHPSHSFALAWIGVIAVNPCDIFNAGCQLSFLAVAVLVWASVDGAKRRLIRCKPGSMRPALGPRQSASGCCAGLAWPMRSTLPFGSR